MVYNFNNLHVVIFSLVLGAFHCTFDNFYELCDFSSYTLQIRWCDSTSIGCSFLFRALFLLLLFVFAFLLVIFIVLIVIYKRLYFLVVNLITTSLLFAQASQIEHHRFDQPPSIIALEFQLSIIASADSHYSVVKRSLQRRYPAVIIASQPSLDIIAPGYTPTFIRSARTSALSRWSVLQ